MAIKYTDKGQEHTIDVLDPGTRGSQTSTYYGAWGSSGTAPAVTDTTLTEHPEARVACTVSQPATNTIRYVFEITATGNRAVQEAGVFTASTGGLLLIRLTHSTLNIETGDRTEYTVNHVQKDVSE